MCEGERRGPLSRMGGRRRTGQGGSGVLFFFQAEDGIRDVAVTGVQTCALPISGSRPAPGGDFTFTLVISNPGPTDLTLMTLVDSVYGDLFDSANPDVTDNTCDDRSEERRVGKECRTRRWQESQTKKLPPCRARR